MITKFFYKTTFVFFIFSTIINAQFKIGLAGGANFATYTLSNAAQNITLKNKLGFSIGAFAEYSLTNKLSVRILAQYIQRGGKNIIPAISQYENKIYFNYIELSPYLNYKFVEDKISAGIMGGLSFGNLLNAKVNNGKDELDIKDSIKPFNIIANLGLEVEVPIFSKTSLIINGIYSIGLKNISKMPGELKTKDVGTNIGFSYNL